MSTTEKFLMLIWQKKKKKSLASLHGFMLSDQDNGKKKPTENNQSSSIFQLVWFHLSCSWFSHRWRFWRRGTGEPRATQRREDVPDVGAASATPQLPRGLAGDGVTACCTLPPVTSPVCPGPALPPPEVKPGADVWSHCKRKSTESWVHNSGLLTDMMDVFVTAEGYNGLQPPCPMKYWSLFLWILFSCTCTCFILRLFFFPFHFITVSFTAFSFWFPLDLYLFLFFCISVLVWFGLRLLCVLKSRVQCLQVEFESSSSPQFWSDGVCVFIKSLLLLNVQSVAFVQGKCWRQCNCNKCWNLSWVFLKMWVEEEFVMMMCVWCWFYLLNVSIKEKSSGWLFRHRVPL